MCSLYLISAIGHTFGTGNVVDPPSSPHPASVEILPLPETLDYSTNMHEESTSGPKQGSIKSHVTLRLNIPLFAISHFSYILSFFGIACGNLFIPF